MAKKTPWPKLIRQMRLAKDFSQDDAAEAAGVSAITWLRWEKDGFSPSQKQQQRIAKALGCTVEELSARFAKEVAESDELDNGGPPGRHRRRPVVDGPAGARRLAAGRRRGREARRGGPCDAPRTTPSSRACSESPSSWSWRS